MCCKFLKSTLVLIRGVHIDFYPRESCEVYQYHRIFYILLHFFFLCIVVGGFGSFSILSFVSLSNRHRVRDGPNIKIHFILHRCVKRRSDGGGKLNEIWNRRLSHLIAGFSLMVVSQQSGAFGGGPTVFLFSHCCDKSDEAHRLGKKFFLDFNGWAYCWFFFFPLFSSFHADAAGFVSKRDHTKKLFGSFLCRQHNNIIDIKLSYLFRPDVLIQFCAKQSTCFAWQNNETMGIPSPSHQHLVCSTVKSTITMKFTLSMIQHVYLQNV